MKRRTALLSLLLGAALLAAVGPGRARQAPDPATAGTTGIAAEAAGAPEGGAGPTPHPAVEGGASVVAAPVAGNPTTRETWYQFYEKGRPISDIIALVFLLGLIFVLDEVRKIFFDSLRSRSLRRIDFERTDLDAISAAVEKRTDTQMGRLLGTLLSSYQTTGSVAGIFQEVNLTIQHLQDQFNSFRSRLDLLSDSAGALGLLGTVWGIFITFEVENWTQDTVLKGMGLALVTTFIGIVVSLVLNFLSTEVFNYFNRRNDLLQMASRQLRVNMIERVNRRNGGAARAEVRERMSPEERS